MDEDEYDITVCHGNDRHTVIVKDSTTGAQLATKVREVTNVKELNQRLIHRGETMPRCPETMESFGVGPGSEVLLMSLAPEFEHDDASFDAIWEVETALVGFETPFYAALSQVDDLAQMDVVPLIAMDAVKQNIKHYEVHNENFMRCLEKLDGIDLKETDIRARRRRKLLVRRIQELMERGDQEQERLKAMLQEYTKMHNEGKGFQMIL